MPHNGGNLCCDYSIDLYMWISCNAYKPSPPQLFNFSCFLWALALFEVNMTLLQNPS